LGLPKNIIGNLSFFFNTGNSQHYCPNYLPGIKKIIYFYGDNVYLLSRQLIWMFPLLYGLDFYY